MSYGLEDRKGFVGESEEGVSRGLGGSAQSQLCARPARANAKFHAEWWQEGDGFQKKKARIEKS